MKKDRVFVFLNDTRSELHWGCWGVSSSILELIGSDSNVLLSISTHELKQKTVKLLISKIVRFVDKSCVEMIINGEGSLHMDNIEGSKIVNVVNGCRKIFGTSRFAHHIWNASIYMMPESWLIFFSTASTVVVRDSRSQHMLSKACAVKKSPDLLFLYGVRNVEPVMWPNTLIISDSVNSTHHSTSKDLNMYEENSLETVYIDIRWGIKELICNCPRYNESLKLASSLRLASTLIYRTFFRRHFHTFNGNILPCSERMYIGRYHLCVLYLLFGMSFKALSTNGDKIKALLNYIQTDFYGIGIEVCERNNVLDVNIIEYEAEALKDFIINSADVYKQIAQTIV